MFVINPVTKHYFKKILSINFNFTAQLLYTLSHITNFELRTKKYDKKYISPNLKSLRQSLQLEDKKSK